MLTLQLCWIHYRSYNLFSSACSNFRVHLHNIFQSIFFKINVISLQKIMCHGFHFPCQNCLRQSDQGHTYHSTRFCKQPPPPSSFEPFKTSILLQPLGMTPKMMGSSYFKTSNAVIAIDRLRGILLAIDRITFLMREFYGLWDISGFFLNMLIRQCYSLNLHQVLFFHNE